MAMAQKDLIPQSKRTKEEQKKIAAMGGKASGVTRRKKRDMAQWAKVIGAMETKETYGDELLTNLGKIVLGQIELAKSGDTRAAEFVYKLLGGSENLNVKTDTPAQLTIEEAKTLVLAMRKDL